MLLSLFSALVFSGLLAQSVDKAKDYLKENKIAEAKDEIDKALAVEKNQKNPEAWYIKAKIYDAVGSNEQLKNQYPDCWLQALSALQKYAELDTKKRVSLTEDNYKPATEIYQGLFQSGAANYNAQKYNDALRDFRGAITAINFMYGQRWIKQSMDTTSILYAGISAEKSNQRDTAAVYYRMIADSNITKIGGNEMAEIYKWLADYYTRKADQANAAKYVALGRSHYPHDIFLR